MRPSIFISVFFLNIFPSFSQTECDYNNRSSLFGERSVEMPAAPGNVVRVFMDKLGYYYPEMLISDAELRNSCSSLKEWYAAHPAKLKLLCSEYRVSIAAGQGDQIRTLNDSVAAGYLKAINSKVQAAKVVDVLIHGFRKKAYGKKDEISTYSTDDNSLFERELSGNADSILFVEVYWDSKFITPLKSYKYRGFELFEKAGIPNAEIAGLHLREVVSNIRFDHINIITHSLGAKAGCELLFNAAPALQQDESLIKTPSQKDIRLCMIEPAIGADLFEHYYSRTTGVDFRSKDNYRVGFVYNENDFVLLKAYHMGMFSIISTPAEYGNTSLGCNYKGCVGELKKLFAERYPNSYLEEPFDFSGIGSDHRLVRYGGYEKFAAVIAFLNAANIPAP